MEMNYINNKQSLRNYLKEERKKLDIKALSLKLVNKLKLVEEYKNAKNVMIFYPLKYEVDLLTLLEDTSKNFYLPKIDGDTLLCCPYHSGDDLCISCFNTKEPVSDGINKTILDLVIVPALAIDKNNYRLGYGGGYYDRFLQGLNCNKITCIANEFIVESVFPNGFDIKIDKIITA